MTAAAAAAEPSLTKMLENLDFWAGILIFFFAPVKILHHPARAFEKKFLMISGDELVLLLSDILPGLKDNCNPTDVKDTYQVRFGVSKLN